MIRVLGVSILVGRIVACGIHSFIFGRGPLGLEDCFISLDLRHQRIISRTNSRCRELPMIRVLGVSILVGRIVACGIHPFIFGRGPLGLEDCFISLDLSRQVGWRHPPIINSC